MAPKSLLTKNLRDAFNNLAGRPEKGIYRYQTLIYSDNTILNLSRHRILTLSELRLAPKQGLLLDIPRPMFQQGNLSTLSPYCTLLYTHKKY
jgi:hypothetical protein